ncbi:MAG: hypothetical protein AAFU64_04090, partial [Bacteroidota bacterium]
TFVRYQNRKIMTGFRILLIIFILGIFSYTSVTIYHFGLNLFAVFFGDMGAMTWAGQFNLDFLSFLLLAGLWVAWRNDFSAFGVIFGLLVCLGGMPLLASYLLYLSFQEKGNIHKILVP